MLCRLSISVQDKELVQREDKTTSRCIGRDLNLFFTMESLYKVLLSIQDAIDRILRHMVKKHYLRNSVLDIDREDNAKTFSLSTLVTKEDQRRQVCFTRAQRAPKRCESQTNLF